MDVTYLEELPREISVLHDPEATGAPYRRSRRERPGVVHSHTDEAGTLGRVAAIGADVPARVRTLRGHVLGRGTSRLVVLTPRQRREMADELKGAPRDGFAVVPLGLERDVGPVHVLLPEAGPVPWAGAWTRLATPDREEVARR